MLRTFGYALAYLFNLLCSQNTRKRFRKRYRCAKIMLIIILKRFHYKSTCSTPRLIASPCCQIQRPSRLMKGLASRAMAKSMASEL